MSRRSPLVSVMVRQVTVLVTVVTAVTAVTALTAGQDSGAVSLDCERCRCGGGGSIFSLHCQLTGTEVSRWGREVRRRSSDLVTRRRGQSTVSEVKNRSLRSSRDGQEQQLGEDRRGALKITRLGLISRHVRRRIQADVPTGSKLGYMQKC